MSARIIAALAVAASVVGGPAAAAGASAARTPHVRACYDGRCVLTLSAGVTFRVSPRFGITKVSISFTAERVHVKGIGSRGTSEALFGKGGSGSVNGIAVGVVSLSAGRAVLRLTPEK